MADIGCLDTMEDHVHDADDIGEGLDLLAVEGVVLESRYLTRRELRLILGQVIIGLDEEAGAPASTIIDGLTDPWRDHSDDGLDEWSWGVVLSPVATGIAHVLDLGLVEMRELVLLLVETEVHGVDDIQDLTQFVAARDLVLELGEDLPDLVLDRVGILGPEFLQIGKEFRIDEFLQVITVQRTTMVKLALGGLGTRPGVPLVLGCEDVGILCPSESGRGLFRSLQVVEVAEEEDPRGLFHVVELCRRTGIGMEDIVDILESLFKHSGVLEVHFIYPSILPRRIPLYKRVFGLLSQCGPDNHRQNPPTLRGSLAKNSSALSRNTSPGSS